MFLDCIEIVPEVNAPSPEAFAPKNDRNDGLRAVIGQNAVDTLASGKLFMIGTLIFTIDVFLTFLGCGAIGCEMLKNYAMMGFGAGDQGSPLTDTHPLSRSCVRADYNHRQ